MPFKKIWIDTHTYIYMNKENILFIRVRRTPGKGFCSSVCHLELRELNLTGWLQPVFLRMPQVLARGRADAGARPRASLPCHPPGWRKGVILQVVSPARGMKWGGCLFRNHPEHRAEDGASWSSHAPPSPIPGGRAMTRRLLGQPALQRCLPERVLKQLPGPGRLPSCLCWCRAAQRCCTGHEWGTAGFATSSQRPFWKRSRVLNQGALCQCTSHLGQDKGWKILILKAIKFVLHFAYLSLYLTTFAKISVFSLVPVFYQQLKLCSWGSAHRPNKASLEQASSGDNEVLQHFLGQTRTRTGPSPPHPAQPAHGSSGPACSSRNHTTYSQVWSCFVSMSS